MRLVIPKQNFHLRQAGYYWNFIRAANATSDGGFEAKGDEIYVMTDDCVASHQEMLEILKIEHKVDYPADWDYKAALASDKDVIRVCIIHGTGSGYGDILSGMYAVDRMKARFAEAGKTLVVNALVRETAMLHYYDVCRIRDSLDRIYPFTMTIDDLLTHDYTINTETLIGDPAFEKENFYDYWLIKFGMPHEGEPKDASVSPSPRVMEFCLGAADVIREEAGAGLPFCLLNLHATRLRAIPHLKWTDLARALAKHFRILSVATGPDVHESDQWLAALPEDLRGKVTDISHVTRKGWDYLAGMLHYLADVVVTPDTGLLHLAGIMRKPTVGIFFTIEPDQRIRYFPTVRGYVEDEWREGEWWGEHKARGMKQMEILEQTQRAKQDDAYIELWDLFRPEAVADAAVEMLGHEKVKPLLKGYRDRRHPRVAVFSYDREGNYFEDRLQSSLIPSILPGDTAIDWFPWRPYQSPGLCNYDLIIFGSGSGLWGGVLDQPGLVEMLRAARHSIGIFGIECLDTVQDARLQEFIGALDRWYTRSRQDLAVAGNPKNAEFLGAWQMGLWPMNRWDTDSSLVIDGQAREAHAIDHAACNIPRARRVVSHHLSPLLCALTGSEEVQYVEEWRDYERKKHPVKVFQPILTDIFGKSPHPKHWMKVRREQVETYKAAQAHRTQKLRRYVHKILGRAP